ncbi:PA3496 family putative envelope integrity protein [Thiolinea disciformis]|uniref:PA3496 family putative envelope integrity protein n=1 Tax=Thiolinea disciformis TaxID=125614 RepID=UPI00037E8361|nr:hypothetical protein [Thiolinea disciformis]
MHDETLELDHEEFSQNLLNSNPNAANAKTKSQAARRNIEDLMEKKQLARRLKDVFDEDFLRD